MCINVHLFAVFLAAFKGFRWGVLPGGFHDVFLLRKSRDFGETVGCSDTLLMFFEKVFFSTKEILSD